MCAPAACALCCSVSDMPVSRHNLLAVAQLYPIMFKRFLPALLGNFDPQHSALLHDLVCDQMFTNAVRKKHCFCAAPLSMLPPKAVP